MNTTQTLLRMPLDIGEMISRQQIVLEMKKNRKMFRLRKFLRNCATSPLPLPSGAQGFFPLSPRPELACVIGRRSTQKEWVQHGERTLCTIDR